MNRYYNTDFDYSKSQPVQSIGTSAYVIRRSTWERVGLFDERFRWAMPDLAYNYMLHRLGYKIYYTPCARVVHFGGQTASQDVLRALREQCQGLIDFSEAYDYFGKGRITKAIVRFGVRFRYCTKVLGYYLSSDKRVIKGPGAPRKEVASEAKRILAGVDRHGFPKRDLNEKAAARSQSASDAASMSD